MRTLKASFLLIGSWEDRLQELGAHIATDLTQAWHWVQDSTYDVIALSVTVVLGKRFPDFFTFIKEHSPGTQFIAVVPEDFSANQLAYLHEQFQFCRVMTSFHDRDVEAHLFAALEEANQRKQDENLAVLMREQTSQLKKLHLELEERVNKRTAYLSEARRKLFFTNSRIEAFRRALMSVHQASSLQEIEQFLNDSMTSSVQTSWIRVLYHPQDEQFAQEVEAKLDFTQLQIPLFSQNHKIGSIFFLRPPSFPFTREEIDFLNRVAEAVALALNRIQKLKESEDLKKQWEATFNSMSDPVLLIDINYDIIQSNKVLEERLRETTKDPSSRKCYKVLFNKEEPCAGCQRGHNFRLNSYETYSQSLTLDPDRPPVFVNLYHDITEQLKMERQILESAKMAELGTIGSSIAHELNNPLGGILSFVQLIKMDMKSDHPLYDDILEMENGVRRCKDIVQNLLGFTRMPDSDQVGDVSLHEVCLRALKIVELQTKSQGIEVKLHLPGEDILTRGHLNLLAQGLKNVLQNSIDHLTEKIRLHKGFRGCLDLEISADAQNAFILIKDNGAPEKNPHHPLGLGVSVAHQIFRDNKANLEFFSDLRSINLAKISFSRLVLRS